MARLQVDVGIGPVQPPRPVVQRQRGLRVPGLLHHVALLHDGGAVIRPQAQIVAIEQGGRLPFAGIAGAVGVFEQGCGL
ncbi:hypothetical protein ROTAS13_03988 [Roseomonas sp. TAS13]|nr:hypothetical protein NF552_07730 [Roseomonas mucosa]GAV36301.1 hypothetical protein ROTAS13_03988 [Roseomonas sp. TAS13]